MKERTLKNVVKKAVNAGEWIIVYLKEKINRLGHAEGPAESITIGGGLFSITCPCDGIRLYVPLTNIHSFITLPPSLNPHNDDAKTNFFARLVASEYVKVKTQFRDRTSLIDALKEMYNGHVEVWDHEDMKNLVGIGNKVRVQKAEIIVRKECVGSASNDLGWYLNKETGFYESHVSEFDARTHFNKEKQTQLDNLYAKHTILNTALANKQYAQVLTQTKQEIVIRLKV